MAPQDYDSMPPFVKGCDTSLAAALSVLPSAQAVRARIYHHIETLGEEGATDNEVERALGLRHQTASARRRELVQRGFVYDTGDRRRTDSGRKAKVWRAAEPEQRAALAARQATGSLQKAINARVSTLGPTQCKKLLLLIEGLDPEPPAESPPEVPTSKSGSVDPWDILKDL